MDILTSVSNMLKAIQDGAAIAQSAADMLPVDTFPRIQSLPEGRHIGFGFFEGVAPGGDIFEFTGGGAMQRAELPDGETLAWSKVTAKDYSADSNALFAELGIYPHDQESYLLEWQQALIEDAQDDI